MKNKQKQVSLTKPQAPGQRFRFTPIVVAMSAIGFASPALAVDRTWFEGTGDWNTVTNWAPNGVPGSSDRAIIGGGSAALTFDTGVAGFNVLGGRLSGAGDLAVSGLTTFTGGQIGGGGGNVIAEGGLAISGATNKTLGYSGGPVSSGIVNNGNATWSGAGNLDNYSSGRLTNSAGATFDIQTDADFQNGTFINQGSLVKSVGATDGSDRTIFTGTLNNTGSIDVQQGTLAIYGAGAHTGSFTTSANSWIEIGAGSGVTQQLNAGSSITGNLRLIDSSSTTYVNNGATYNTTRTEIVNGGRLSFSEPNTTAHTATLGVSGGALNGAGDLAVSGLTTFTGGQIGGGGGNVIAEGGLAISGATNKTLGYSGGPVSSGIVNNGNATWSGAGNLDNYSSGRLTNSAGATFDIQTDADFQNGTFINQGSLVKSVGATDGSDRTIFTGTLNNTGSIDVQQGTLTIYGAGAHTGSFTTSANSWIEIGAGSGVTQQLNAGSSITGNLRLIDSSSTTYVNNGATYNTTRTEIVNGGRLSFSEPNTTAHTATLGVSGGALNGAGDLAVSGLTTFTGGQIGGGGGNVIAEGGLAISGATNKTLGYSGGPVSSGIVNNGNATWSGAGNLDNYSSGRLTNSAGATFDIQTDADFQNGTFINQGSLVKSVGATDGSDKTVISGTLDNTNTGKINVQQGTLEVSSAFNNGGTIDVASGAVFYGSNRTFSNAGTLQGDGTFQTLLNNALVNNGKIDPGNGIGHLAIDGDLNQSGSGIIDFQLASLGSFDTLTVSGDVTLGGNLLIANLGYAPVVGDTFVVATFDERLNNSHFSSIDTDGYASGVAFTAIYNEHDVTLQVTAVTAVPEPENWAMLVAGLGLMGFIIRRRRNDRLS